MAVRTALFKHQTEGFERFKDQPYGGLFFEPGLGKTLTALKIIDRRVAADPSYRTLVVVPATLIENWHDEIKKHTDMTCELLVGSRAKREKALFAPANIYIINYEGARVITDALISRRFNCIICDESQALKDPQSLQSKACFRIACSVPHRIIMTGTPILNSPLDVFGQMRCLSVDIWGMSYYRFRAMYAIMGGFLNKMVLKYINMDRFKRRVQQYATIKTKAECLDLPDRLYEVAYVDLPEAQSKMYKDLRDEFVSQFKDTIVSAPVVLTRLIRFSQITAGFYKDVKGEEHAFEKNPKAEWLVQWLKENQKKAVVFCRFRKEISDLEDRLTREGIKHTGINGSVPVDERISLVKKFNTDPDTQVFIGQLDVAGQGINLIGASYVIFLSNSYSYGDREQAECRIHRIGQTQNCTYIDVICRGTVDQHVLRALSKKQSLASMLTGELVRMA
jgi:SNF2 family DNA or RNA helicase